MYYTFFGLQEKPFSVTPDPRFLFLSRSHQEALGHLLYGIDERKGFIAITGEVGTGKTLLCRALLERLGHHVRTALVFNSCMSDLELLRSITEDFGILAAESTRKALIDHLNTFLIREFRDGRNAVLIIDEAQNLAPEVLEQIRMLSNLETERGKLLQIILVGQPELRQQLARSDLRQLNQRIAIRYHLRPFNHQETTDYINHRLLVAGSHGGVKFSPRALSCIYRHSQGIPRKINLLCDRTLLSAYVQGSTIIDRKLVRHASLELAGEESHAFGSFIGSGRRGRLIAQGMVAGLALTLAGGAWLSYQRQQHVDLAALIADIRHAVGDDRSTAGTSEVSITAEVFAAPSHPPELPEAAQPDWQDVPERLPSESLADASPAAVVAAEPIDQSPMAAAEPASLALEGEVLLRAVLWEYRRDLQRSHEGGKATLTNVAASFGLQMLTISPALQRLKQFRIASLVETSAAADADPTLLILRAASPDGVELMDTLGAVRRLTNVEFAAIWSGRAYLFYRTRAAMQRILSRGKQGVEVRSLQLRLGELGYFGAAPSGVFDDETVEAVRRFQRDHDLHIDGAAGPATKAVIYHLVGQSLIETGHP
jgi:general secretion pathway protein A